jgi:transketolase
MLTPQRSAELNNLCRTFRRDVIRLLHAIQTGHPGGSLSVCEILTVLYFVTAQIDATRPQDPQRDRILLSKGHAAPMLYRILAEKGFFPLADLQGLRQFGCHLQGHPCTERTPGVELPSGPLGIGLSAGLGKALALRLDDNPARVFVVLGDGELNEGTIWEAAMSAAKFGLDRVTAIVDRNHVQLDGPGDVIMPLADLAAKWLAFGWRVLTCNGHDVAALAEAYRQAGRDPGGRPTVILAETVKGKGVSFMEGKSAWHGSPINDAQLAQALLDLGGEA